MESKQLIDTLMLAVDQALSNVHTATIAKVTGVNAKTINCRPVTDRVVDGEAIKLPEFIDVPPLFMQGGGSYTAHPIAVGDYCLLVFTERCFDRWYNGQDFQPPLEMRMHDYSDGIALVGINPLAGAITIPDVIQHTGDANQDGNYTHQGSRNHTGTLTQEGDINLTGEYVQVGGFDLTGDMLVDGHIDVTGVVSAAGFSGLLGGPMESTVDINTTKDVNADGNIDAASYSVGGAAGASGTFTTSDSKTVTVVNGIITSII